MNTLGERIRSERTKQQLSQEQLGDRVGVSQQAIEQIENGSTKNPRRLLEIATALGVNGAWLRSGTGQKFAIAQITVPLVGRVGAGAEVHLFDGDSSSSRIDDVDSPPGADEHTVAVVVVGSSMAPVFQERDLIYYQNVPGPPENLIGRECVVGLADGRVFVKILQRGNSPGFFNLFSYNAPLIADVVVDWAVRVMWVRRAE